MRIAVCPGSFDPITCGHVDIILRAAQMFDKVYVAVSNNTSKKYMFDFSTRVRAAHAAFSGYENISVASTDGLVADFAKAVGACAIVKGTRDTSDFTNEYTQYLANYEIAEIETVFLPSKKELAHLSSTFVKELIIHGKPYGKYIPNGTEDIIKTY